MDQTDDRLRCDGFFSRPSTPPLSPAARHNQQKLGNTNRPQRFGGVA
jgi:hypothetical protein